MRNAEYQQLSTLEFTSTLYSGLGHTNPSISPALTPRSFATTAQMVPRHAPEEVSTGRLSDKLHGVGLYYRYVLAGAVCCAFTHAILTPVDM